MTPYQSLSTIVFKAITHLYDQTLYKQNFLSSQHGTLTEKIFSQVSRHSNATLNYFKYILHACGLKHVPVGRKKPHRKRGNFHTQIGTPLSKNFRKV